MSQFYARIFEQILDSSIAEDFTLRHVYPTETALWT
jgi:hypothetical protein